MHLRSARCFLARGFHAWLVRAPSARARSDEEFGAKVCASFISSYRTYGARRVWHDLLAEGLACGLHRIERLMRVQGLKARSRRRGLPKDGGLRSIIAGNLLDRQFTAEAPNQKWIADFTYLWTAEGWLYVAVVIDLFSRRVVGWSMSDATAAQLERAITQRQTCSTTSSASTIRRDATRSWAISAPWTSSGKRR